MLQLGKDAKHLEALARTGVSVPELESSISLAGIGIYWQAFFELSTCRHYGANIPGPIPWTAIKHYSESEAFTEDEEFYLFSIVRAMDSAYRGWMEEVHAKNAQKKVMPRLRGRAKY